jgi:hypothetical protein
MTPPGSRAELRLCQPDTNGWRDVLWPDSDIGISIHGLRVGYNRRPQRFWRMYRAISSKYGSFWHNMDLRRLKYTAQPVNNYRVEIASGAFPARSCEYTGLSGSAQA